MRNSEDLVEVGDLDSLREGLGYLAKERALLWLLITMAVTTLLGVPLVTLLPVFARDVLNVGSSGFGIMVGAFGAGAVFAGILVATLVNHGGKSFHLSQSIHCAPFKYSARLETLIAANSGRIVGWAGQEGGIAADR